jgi:hypothetical protein
MNRPFLTTPVLAAALLLVALPARATDPSAALDELKQGYALKLDGHCHDAIPHFVRSIELGATPKALLNLADCEQQAGDLVSAQHHATQGRDLARQSGDAELTGVADAQLGAIDSRLPRLTVTLARNAPTDCTVSGDGAPIGSTSLGVPIPMNPGAHGIVVVAPGRALRTYNVMLADGAHSQIEVSPGESLDAPQPSTSPTADQARDQAATTQTSSLRRPVALGLVGVGAVGVVVGAVFGVLSKSAHSDADSHCQLGPQANLCDAQGVASGNTAISRGDLSTWTFVGGLVAAGAGAVLWFTAPRDDGGIAIGIAPTIGVGGGGLRIRGVW